MNKEITCRMIDGKPVVEYKEEYIPKKGDIVFIGNLTSKYICVYDGTSSISNFSILLGNSDCLMNNIILERIEYLVGAASFLPATPEESEVMHHILSENSYELKGDTVVKKRWIPKMGEKYWYINSERNRFSTCYSIRGRSPEGEYYYQDCFKTQQTAESACDKLNELRLTLPQE